MDVAVVKQLVLFWALIAVMFGSMLFMTWKFRIGDVHMIRRTAIYFGTCLILLPGLTFLFMMYGSKSLALSIFLPVFLVGTVIYLALTAVAIFRPRG
jgi:hypothetical protein